MCPIRITIVIGSLDTFWHITMVCRLPKSTHESLPPSPRICRHVKWVGVAYEWLVHLPERGCVPHAFVTLYMSTEVVATVQGGQ